MNYQNKRRLKHGDQVVGVDGKGAEVKGKVSAVFWNGKSDAANIAVSTPDGKLVGDLTSDKFLHVDDVEKAATPKKT